ncbi:MAG: SAM-dependent methyltransferase [Clostridia bacterium]|nr:SAM-dependent methyltransferase [Clostridia bacterium]
MENKIKEIIARDIDRQSLKKLILSKPEDKEILKTAAKPFAARGQYYLQFETFSADGKALHTNLTAAESIVYATDAILNGYKQCNIISTGGTCEIKRSKNGKVTVIDKIKGGDKADTVGHNKIKQTILRTGEVYPFLVELGISDGNGRIYDKRRAKFKQINRFLEIIDDIYPKLPKEGTLTVCDLCCGKGYLTFAAYHYFTAIKGRETEMYGMDLKKDVIEYCSATAEKLGYTSLHFECGDISAFDLPRTDLVLSLHACDIATDIVLANAIRMKAGIILSTPCCHHEMMNQIQCDALDFITDHSMLKQKLCDAATDALRALRLEAEGYRVTTIELIDPEDTPKNVLLRCIRHSISQKEKDVLLSKYRKNCEFLGVSPYLDKLLSK